MVIEVHVSTANLRTYVRITGIDKQDTLFVVRGLQTIWELNVSRFFMKHEVSYPRANKFGERKFKPIKEAFSCTVINGVIIGSIDSIGSPQVKYLIHGQPPGEGAFVPMLGVRKKTGHFWGVPTIYWKTWESFFKREIWLLVGQYAGHTDERGPRKHADINAIRAAAIKKIRKQVSSMKGGLL